MAASVVSGEGPVSSVFRADAPTFVPQGSSQSVPDEPTLAGPSAEPAVASESDGDDDPETPLAGSSEIPLRLRAQRSLPQPNRRISPLDVRFSQMRARHEFRDARLLEDSVSEIRPVRCDEAEGVAGATWRLEAPFPPIEVLQWRCKLRDEVTGRPKLDPTTGDELWDASDRWFTLDNRRLYCLQKAAAKLWPERTVIDVVELPPGPLTRIRELKKFRTLDRGRSILIGGRNEGETLVRWSWRQAAGVAEDAESEEDSSMVIGEAATASTPSNAGATMRRNSSDSFSDAAGPVEHGSQRVQLRQPRRRHGGRGGGQAGEHQQRGLGSSWSRPGKYKGANRGQPSGASLDGDMSIADRLGGMSWTSVLCFLGIYLALRFGTKMLTAMDASSSQGGKGKRRSILTALSDTVRTASASEASALIQAMPLSVLVLAAVSVLALLLWSLAGPRRAEQHES